MNKDRTFRWQSITLGTLFVGYAGYYVCRSNLSVTTPLILADLGGEGITKEKIGAIVSLGVGLYAVGKITNGLLADFLGGRRLFLLGMAASVVCTVLFGISSGLIVFGLAWGVNRYVQSAGWGALVKLASRWYPVRLHSTIMAVLCLSYLWGDGLGRIYLGFFMTFKLNWRAIFFIAAATLAAIAAASWFLLREDPKDVGAQEPAGNPDNVFASSGDAARPEGLGQLLAPLLANGLFWLVCVMNFGLTLIRETFNFWTPLYLKEVAQMSDSGAASASSLYPFVGGFSVLIAGAISDRFQGRHGRVVVPALVILVAALWALGSVPVSGKPGMALLLISGVAFFMMGPYSFCSGVMALDLGGKRGSSTAAGLIDSAGYLGAMLSGYGVGKLAGLYGWAAAFQALAGVAGLTAVTAVVYWIRQEALPSKRAALLPDSEPLCQSPKKA